MADTGKSDPNSGQTVAPSIKTHKEATSAVQTEAQRQLAIARQAAGAPQENLAIAREMNDLQQIYEKREVSIRDAAKEAMKTEKDHLVSLGNSLDVHQRQRLAIVTSAETYLENLQVTAQEQNRLNSALGLEKEVSVNIYNIRKKAYEEGKKHFKLLIEQDDMTVGQIQAHRGRLEGLERELDVAEEEAKYRQKEEEFQKKSKVARKEEIKSKLHLEAISIRLSNLGDTVRSAQAWAVGKMIEGTKALTLEYDKQRAELAKLTGGVDTYNRALHLSTINSAQYGLSTAEAMAGTRELIGGFSRINELTSDQQVQMGRLMGQLKTFGIDGVKNMEMARMGLGMTAEASADLTRELFAVGEALGPGMAKQVSEQFGPAMADLAAYTSDRAIKVFKKLAGQARAMGLEISKVLTLVKQFDTFDTAAESVGRLNSLLGGDYLNSVQILHATEDERVDLIKEGMVASGRQFADLARYEKKALAAAIGINDISEAMKLLGTEQDKLDEMSAKATAAGISVEQLSERTKATKTIAEKWAAILQQLAVVMKPVVMILNLILSVLMFLSPLIKAASIGWAIYTTIQYLAATATFTMATAVRALLGPFAIFLLLGQAIYDFMNVPHSLTFLEVLALLGTLLIGAGLAATMTAPALGMLALVAVGLGIGMTAAGYGIKLMAEGLSTMGASLLSISVALGKMGITGLWALTSALLAISYIGIIGLAGGPGLIQMGKGLKIMSEAMEKLSSNKAATALANTKKMFEEMKNITGPNAEAISKALGAFKSVFIDIESKRSEKREIKVKVQIDYSDKTKTHASIEKGIAVAVNKAFESHMA